MRQIILDTETTGLSPDAGHRIIEIGAIEIVDRKITDNNFQTYLNPKRSIDPGSINIHGITDAFVADKPEFQEIMQEFLDFIKDAELVMHNAPFDVAFINLELSLAGFNKELHEICEIKDTLPMARKIHPGKRNSLDALCSRYGVDKTNRALHGALTDAKLLAQVFLLMTGGQEGFFSLDQTFSGYQTSHTSVFDISQRKIITIEPSIDELKDHENFIKKLKKKSETTIH
jgi:DNA polymerase-3 subunit epsilon